MLYMSQDNYKEKYLWKLNKRVKMKQSILIQKLDKI